MVVGAESEKQDKLWRIFKGNVVRSLKLSGSRKHTLSNKTSRFCAIASFWFDVIWLLFDFHFVPIQLPFVLQMDLTSVSVRHKTSKYVFSVYWVREHVPRLIDNTSTWLEQFVISCGECFEIFSLMFSIIRDHWVAQRHMNQTPGTWLMELLTQARSQIRPIVTNPHHPAAESENYKPEFKTMWYVFWK